jgi:hypothetical protein
MRETPSKERDDTMYAGKGNTQGPKQKIRKTGSSILAQDIADSIRLHAEHGIKRTAEFYTSDGSVVKMVERILEGDE